MDTERLYDRSAEAHHQLNCIATARDKAFRQIERIASDLRKESGCTENDMGRLLDAVHDGLSDMLADVVDYWTERQGEADNAISNIERRDLMLARPVL